MAGNHTPTERRPIAARGWPVWRRAAATLADAGVSANMISVAGMVAGLGAGVAFAMTGPAVGELLPSDPGGALPRACFVAAAVLVQMRLLANLLDGMVAIHAGKASAVGELYNEVPDRVSDVAILVGAGYAFGGVPELGYVAACVALLTAYVRAVGKAAGGPQQYGGPMAKQQRMALLTAVALWCGLAPLAWQPDWRQWELTAVGWQPVRLWGLVAVALGLAVLGGLLTALLRLRRTARHLRGAAA